MKKLGIFFCAASILVGCGGGNPHPKMVSFTPASVVVDYSKNDLHEATGLAQQFCSSIEKDAQYVSTKESGWTSSEKLAFFNCIERGKTVAGWAANQGGANNNAHTPIINNFK